MSKISIIVPVYNVEPYLRRCVDSILSQTHSDFELILVNDGSPDGCGAICDEYAEADSRIRVIHKENGGLSSARNAALDVVCEEKCAEWITFIDSDDWVHPEYLESLFWAAKKTGAAIAISDYVTTDDDAQGNVSNIVFTYLPERYWVKIGNLMACAKLYRRELFDNARYPIGKLHEDAFLTHQLIFACKKLAYTPSKTYFYYQSTDSITRSDWTPRRMHVIDAMHEQLAYFKKHNYRKARIQTELKLACLYNENINLAIASNENGKYNKEIEKMICGLRAHIKKNAKYISIRYAEDPYVIAFPEKERKIRKKAARRRKAVAFIKKILKTLGIRK